MPSVPSFLKPRSRPWTPQVRLAVRSPARKGGAEIDLYFGAEPAGVRPLAAADAVVQPVERERTGHHRLAAALAHPERDLRVAALSLDVEHAARELPIAPRLHGFAGERDARMAANVKEFLLLERRVDLGQPGFDRRGLEPHVDARDLTLYDAQLASEPAEGAAEWRARLPQLERHAAPCGIHRVALVGGCRQRRAYQQDQEESRHQSTLGGFQGSMRRITPSRSTSSCRRAAATCSATSEASKATSPMCSALNRAASSRSFETRSGTLNIPNQLTDRPEAEA